MHVSVNRVFNNVSRNLGLKNYSNNLDSWSEWAFEAEQYIGSNKTFLQKELVYSANCASATATVEFIETYDKPLDIINEFIEINGARFTFVRPVGLETIDIGVNFQHKSNLIDVHSLTLGDKSDLLDTTKTLSSVLEGFVRKFNAETVLFTEGVPFENTLGVKASLSGTTLTFTVDNPGIQGNDYTINSSCKFKVTPFSGGKNQLHNKQLRLPDNYVKVLSVRAGNAIIQPTSSQYKSKVSSLLDRFYINGNRINFTTNYTDDVVVTVLAVPLSQEGYPMILQGHEEAVAHYIMWKHKLIGYYAGEVPQYIVKDLERRWYQLCGKVRGDDNMPTSIELLKIGKLWNTKIPLTSFNPPLYDGLNSY